LPDQIQLACTVEGNGVVETDAFSGALCDLAKQKTAEASGRDVVLVAADDLVAGGSWLHVRVQVVSRVAAVGTVEWYTGSGAPHKSPKVEAGISDAELNEGVAALMINDLMRFATFKAPANSAES